MKTRHPRSAGRTRILCGGIKDVPKDESPFLRNPSGSLTESRIGYQKFEPWNFTRFEHISTQLEDRPASPREPLSGAGAMRRSPARPVDQQRSRGRDGRNYRPMPPRDRDCSLGDPRRERVPFIQTILDGSLESMRTPTTGAVSTVAEGFRTIEFLRRNRNSSYKQGWIALALESSSTRTGWALHRQRRAGDAAIQHDSHECRYRVAMRAAMVSDEPGRA